MVKESHLIRQLSLFKQAISKKFGIERVIFFGSSVSGKVGPHSDIDLILVSKRFGRKKFFERPIGLYAYWRLPYPVDFICLSDKEFERDRKKVSLVSEALRTGIEIT